MMPVMDGYQFLKKIKADPSLMSIPVVVVSGSNDSKAESEILKLGAMDLLKKPFSREVIIQRVQNIVQLCEGIANMSANQSLINDMPCSMVIFAVGKAIRMTFASEWFVKEFFDGRMDEVLNRYESNAMELFDEKDRGWLEEKIRMAAVHQELVEEEARLMTDEGFRWVFVRARFVYSKDEESFYYISLIDREAHMKM